MFCTKCGQQIEDGVKFCTYCGKPVSGGAVVQTAEVAENAVPKSGKGVKIALAVLLAVLALAGAGALGWYVGSSMGDDGKQIVSNMSEDDKDDKDKDDKDKEDKDKDDKDKEDKAEEENDKEDKDTEEDDKKDKDKEDGDKKDIGEDKADKDQSDQDQKDIASTETQANQDVQTEVGISEQGKVLNIYSWNEEFLGRLEEYYPGYEAIDSTTGRIGDVTVKYIIVAADDNEYQNNLDKALVSQINADADDRVDIFLIEPHYAAKYVDTDYTLALSDLGISEDDLSDQYQFAKDVATDYSGKLKGISWQVCPGVMIYNREIAKEVWGTDDPQAIQKKVSTWAAFERSAHELYDEGYCITSSVYDTYRTYSCNRSSAWVVDGKINVDANVEKWAKDSKKLYESGYTDTYAIWGEDWFKGFYPEGKVFCYFGPEWFLNYSMASYIEGSVGYNGDWAVTAGPEAFFWGGNWICAAQGTDNRELIRDIMLYMTCDEGVMRKLAAEHGDPVNNVNVMAEKAVDSTVNNPIIGGQNPWSVYAQNAEDLDLSLLTYYDETCDQEFQNAMYYYIIGEEKYEKALENFYSAVTEIHPELSY